MQHNKIVAGYVRRSSEMQSDNYSRDAQIRGITQQCQSLGLPVPIIYEDDELSARGEQIANRPAFKRLLEDVEAGRVQMVIVHSLDRWSRNVMVTLQSFRILAEHQTTFLSLSEHIDYSTPEGRLQLTILAAFAAYFSDMLAKHTSKGKGERAAQGLPNGDIPFGYRWTGSKSPPDHDLEEFPGLRMIGELRMQGKTAEQIADAVNAAGYRTGSKRFGNRLFTIDTINAMMRCEFYAGFAPGDDRGTILYKGQRFRGRHLAAFTFEEWQRIRIGAGINYKAPHRSEQAQRIYEFSGYIVCAHCGLNLRCRGASANVEYAYYKDMAKARQLPCPVGGYRQVRTDLVTQQFGDLLQSLRLPAYWRDMIRENVLERAKETGLDTTSIEREKERLKLKRGRLLKHHRAGYIDDAEFEGEIAAINLTLRDLAAPAVDGVHLEDILTIGERLPGMAALWSVATPQERREMVILLLEPGGLHYNVKQKEIVALVPRPTFLPVLRLLEGVIEYEEATGMLIIACGREQRKGGR
jgi:DNA invertase Pin-like site-specific DNA recombinase